MTAKPASFTRSAGLIGLLSLALILFNFAPPARAQFSFDGDDNNSFANDAAAAKPIVTADATWDVPKAHAGDTRILAIQLHIADGYHINPDKDQARKVGDFEPYPASFKVVEAPLDVVGLEQAVWPAPHGHKAEYVTGGELMVYEHEATLFLKAKVLPNAAPGRYALKFEFTYQACTNVFCAAPATLPITAVLDVVPASEPVGEASDTNAFASYQDLAGYTTFHFFGWTFRVPDSGFLGGLLMLFAAAFGGFLLNFTPCVLPVIPIKILGLSQHAGSRRRAAMLGGVLALGVTAFWIAIGVLIISLKIFTATNELFGLPAFTISVGVFIAAMAIGMAGFFTINLPKQVYLINPNSQTLAGSFVFGVMTAVLSLPCTAPFMGAALGWSTQQPTTLALFTFLAVGLGMALPYFVLSANPQLVEWMPRTGPASELLKQVLGLLMLAAALYFIGTGVSALIQSPPNPPTTLYWWPVVLAVVAAAGWLIYRTFRITRSPARRAVFAVLGVLAIGGSVYAGAALTSHGPINWVYYTPERFEQALQRGDVVVLDFTAEWCLNCKTLEHTQLTQAPLVKLLNGPGVVPMKVDITGDNPAGREKLKQAGRLTIPLLVVYAPDGREAFKSDAYFASEVIAAIDAAR